MKYEPAFALIVAPATSGVMYIFKFPAVAPEVVEHVKNIGYGTLFSASPVTSAVFVALPVRTVFKTKLFIESEVAVKGVM